METTNKFTKIKGISDIRRLPRIAKIRLGVKVISKKTGNEYPKEVDYFVVPEAVAKIYGDKPKELDIMMPTNDPEIFFPQSYKAYGADQRLKCKGNGETAERWIEDGLQERTCPCEWLEEKKCAKRAHLMVFLPKVSLGGVFQLDSGSGRNIVTINSYIDYLFSLIGRCAMIPLKLIREPQKVQYEGKMSTHYLLRLEYQGNIEEINRLRSNTQQVLDRTANLMLEAPKEEGPEDDTPIVYEEDDVKTEEQTEETNNNKLTPEKLGKFTEAITKVSDMNELNAIWAEIATFNDVMEEKDKKILTALKNKKKKRTYCKT